MGKKLSFFKRGGEQPFDPETNAALRELAGWPTQQHQRGGYRARHQNIVIHRDGDGRIIGSVEQINVDEYEEYSDTWGR